MRHSRQVYNLKLNTVLWIFRLCIEDVNEINYPERQPDSLRNHSSLQTSYMDLKDFSEDTAFTLGCNSLGFQYHL